MDFLRAFTFSLLMMLFITPKLMQLAYKIDYLEKPKIDCERKIHNEAKPYLAGVGIFFSFWIAYFSINPVCNIKNIIIFLSSLLIFIVGMFDDYYKIKKKDLKALPKMIFQLLACILVYEASGVKFSGITNPFDGSYVVLPIWLQFTLTICWLFGVTTVINFIDGMDGLAGGITCISSCTLFLVALVKNDLSSALMAIILVGICLGYLKYNKFPSKILMGDSGATFLGFILGIISLDGAFKQATAISIFIPILVLGLPIFDNIFVLFKRIHEGRPIYIGDASQIHFRLLAKGLNQKQVVYLLYLACACLNLSAIVLLFLKI
ncbi:MULTISPECIES: MraY family glycosyltransferase [unclassified Clostridium]|uniref:MraY family glycosyltransferase n=1 Tax=unclassified Clostridium TaxID=2614128 RepID=UPI0002983BDE|nr:MULTISPECIES: MraY family glycosyltransferase [unclassified Clostridium]EKQ57959.1 MAG: UDP-N-acetylmuramyl pentapeptide phosphotransferase/UDP-N-acetylglucosamine-1-phosphate transferase [Clostridium sp. Maddingley MBC34-26]